VIPYYIFSPRHEAARKNIKGELTPLAQYSDVLFLEYSRLAGRAKPKADVSGLKYLLFHNIENPNTWSTVLKALINANKGKKDIPMWPGTEFDMNSAEGKALLGTQIGAPVAWMLIQHKKAFGAKSVVKVCSTRTSFGRIVLTGGYDKGESLPQQEHVESRYRFALLEFAVLHWRCAEGQPL